MARPADPTARTSLIAAAREEFVRCGILKARIEDITAGCGLSKGAFYLHFESKEALFRELVTALEGQFERLRAEREQQYVSMVRGPTREGATRRQPADSVDLTLIDRLRELDLREDRRLLELLWTWRDVIDVLLRGSQGTEFDGVMWQILDQQLERVGEECRSLQQVRLMRDDIPTDILGMMVVGTYLLVVRRLASTKDKPDFEALVRGIQSVMASGVSARDGDWGAKLETVPARVSTRAKKKKVSALDARKNQQKRSSR
jgi:AcrR family transcriptional regulator